jgi:type VI secretion system protein ImpC
MARPFGFGEVHLTAGAESPSATPRQDAPFCIGILSDLGGHSNRKQAIREIANCRAVQIDRDNFDKVLPSLEVEIDLPTDANAQLELQFEELDDFHPDRLFQRARMFAKLRILRTRVADPATFPEVAEDLGLQVARTGLARTEAARQMTPTVASVASNLAVGSLLDATIEQTENVSSGTRPSRTANELDAFVRRITEPHLAATPDPRQAETLAMIDRALSEQMRALLHVPAFHALEAAWRAIYFLVRRIETGRQLKLYLFDISKAELAADLGGAQDWRGSGIYRLLVEKSVGMPGAEPWAILVGNYEFGPAPEDAELLGKFARVAKAAGAPFLAAASPRLLGCASLAESPHPRDWQSPPDADSAATWVSLRALPEAAWVGLALPRFLLRLPYGKETDPIESFDFEEMPREPDHEDYLWGNPAFAGALLLAQSFSGDGWEMRPGSHSEIDGLPLHVYKHNGDSDLKPCAEALLTDEAVERILEDGLIPLVSMKEPDAVRVARFQSIAAPLRTLAGRWERAL